MQYTNLAWVNFLICGLFQMYMGGKLVHADRMFNGYGTTKKDFMKQVSKERASHR